MSVYIESVILNNFFVTMLIACVTCKVLGLSRSKSRLFLCCLVSTIVAVILPLLTFSDTIILVLKLLLAAFLSLILFFKRYSVFRGGLFFLAVTFLFGGALFGVGYFVYGDVEMALTQPLFEFPIGIIIGFGFIIYCIIQSRLCSIKRKFSSLKFMYDIDIEFLQGIVSCSAFLDTGNQLYDDKTSLPIVVVTIDAVMGILVQEEIILLLSSEPNKVFSDAHFITYSTAGGKNSKLLVTKPVLIRLYFGHTPHIIKEVAVGISFANFGKTSGYGAILHPSIVPH